jgi:hypothetical protein
MGAQTEAIAGVKLEIIRHGHGRPILFLHPSNGIDPASPFLDLLAQLTDETSPDKAHEHAPNRY